MGSSVATLARLCGVGPYASALASGAPCTHRELRQSTGISPEIGLVELQGRERHALGTYDVRDNGGGVPVTKDRPSCRCHQPILEIGDPARSASLAAHSSAGGGLSMAVPMTPPPLPLKTCSVTGELSIVSPQFPTYERGVRHTLERVHRGIAGVVPVRGEERPRRGGCECLRRSRVLTSERIESCRAGDAA